MIRAKKISFSYGYEPVFDEVDFSVGKNDKVGIVGQNGAGKSTLFKLLTKQEFPSDGKIEIDEELAMVPQEVKYDPLLSSATDVYSYVDPSHTSSTAQIHTIFSGLELDWTHIGSDLQSLSGGQKTKLALTKAFLARPQILLLDEPTNFLDEAGKKWVMQFLATYPFTLLVVSHDLDLLDRHIKHVLFLNTHTHKIDTYTGNYTQFVRTKKQNDDLLRRKVVNEQKHVKRMEEGLVNLRKMTSKKGVHQRVMQERKIERIKDKLPELPKELATFKAKFPTPIAVGAVPLRVENLSKSFGSHHVITDLTVEVLRGEILALIGPNGVGKTTLIKMLTGELLPDTGKVIASENLALGYYSQETALLDDSQTLFEAVEATQRVPRDRIYGFLMRFLFSKERLGQHIGTLSGGEKTRLSIALLMTHPYNVLVLDEPTTYLDVLSQRVILEALKSYEGAMVLVSHTEEFVQELAPERVLLLPSQKIRVWSPEFLDEVSKI